MAAALAVAGGAVAQRAGVTNLRVSDDGLIRAGGLEGTVHQAEAHLAIDPSNPNHLLGAAQEFRYRDAGAAANGFYVSFDGGGTWSAGLLPGVSKVSGGDFERVTDPVVAIGPDGAAYYSSLGLRGPGNVESAVLVSRSPDGGRTWEPPRTVARGLEFPDEPEFKDFLDKEWLAVDSMPASPHLGTLYSAWTNFHGAGGGGSSVELARSTDKGMTWTAPRAVSAIASLREAAFPLVLVRRDGDVVVIYETYKRFGRGRAIEARVSEDGGRRFRRSEVVVPHHLPGSVEEVRDGTQFAAATDEATGWVYVVWVSRRLARSADVADLYVSRSQNGRAWSTPRRIGDGHRNTAQFIPTIAASHGDVHVLYYEASPRRPRSVKVIDAISRNGGRSFGGRRLVAAPFDIGQAIDDSDRRGRFVGDYQGLVAGRDFAQALWVDPRNGRRSAAAFGGNDVFTARIRTR